MSHSSPTPDDDWIVRKGVDHLKAGDRFIFSDYHGGEGQTLTATGPANNMLGTRTLGTEELDFDLEFYGNAWVTMAVDTEARFGLTDDITTCPKCGSRTEFKETGGPDGEQEHACLNERCRYVFIGFFDPEDFDADGNFIGSEEVSDGSDTDRPDCNDRCYGEPCVHLTGRTVSAWPRDFEENPGQASDFAHLDQGMTVTVINREVTHEPGDDSQTEVVLLPGTEANVIDWVEEWFHVHVRINNNQPGAGQHAWVCPDNIKEKKA